MAIIDHKGQFEIWNLETYDIHFEGQAPVCWDKCMNIGDYNFSCLNLYRDYFFIITKGDLKKLTIPEKKWESENSPISDVGYSYIKNTLIYKKFEEKSLIKWFYLATCSTDGKLTHRKIENLIPNSGYSRSVKFNGIYLIEDFAKYYQFCDFTQLEVRYKKRKMDSSKVHSNKTVRFAKD